MGEGAVNIAINRPRSYSEHTMKIKELIEKLQVFPQELDVKVYESDPDNYVTVSHIDFCKKDVEPHVRICTEFDNI